MIIGACYSYQFSKQKMYFVKPSGKYLNISYSNLISHDMEAHARENNQLPPNNYNHGPNYDELLVFPILTVSQKLFRVHEIL